MFAALRVLWQTFARWRFLSREFRTFHQTFLVRDTLPQLCRPLGNALLLDGKWLCRISALGSRFDSTLQTNEPFDVTQIFPYPLALRFDPLLTILPQQQFQEIPQLGLQLQLPTVGRGKGMAIQCVDNTLKTSRDVTVVALGDQFSQQFRAMRLGGTRKFRQSARQHFQPIEPIGQSGGPGSQIIPRNLSIGRAFGAGTDGDRLSLRLTQRIPARQSLPKRPRAYRPQRQNQQQTMHGP